MSRPLRIQFPGATYHVMNRGSARQKTFLGTEDYQRFLQTLAETHDLWRAEIVAYCLMGNHYHVCLRTPEGNLARVMRHLDGLYTQRFNRAHRRDGPLFRGRYKAIVVEAEAYLAAVVRYIHLNPVEAEVVQAPQAYPWSSHGAYLRPAKRPRWLRVAEVLGQFASPRAFHQFVLAGNEEALTEYYRRGRHAPVLGGEGFRERLRGHLRQVSREHPRHERAVVKASVEMVLQRVAGTYGTTVEDLLQGGRGRENEARKVGMYLVRRLCDLTLQQTADLFRAGSYGLVGWACHGVRAKIQSDRTFQGKVERLQTIIGQLKT